MSGTPQPEIVTIRAHDGVELAAAVYRPRSDAPVPALFAASPYRFDNNTLPASPQFLWRETGPIDFYLARGYAYVHLDLRGCGRSGGTFELLGPNEQRDLYDAIEWIAAQRWCTGKVGSIGQSYYCMVQWFLGALAPPALACIGAHDGLAEIYGAGVYHGGIPCDFFPGYWWYQNRFINRFPATGPGREQDTDLTRLVAAHPLRDDFWRARSAQEVLEQIRVPLFSSGVWGKMQLHTRGNIDGFLHARGPKKLRMSAAPNAWAAAAEFASPAFHERVMLPFYDHYLKGLETGWAQRPAVEYAVRGTDIVRTSDQWPPAGVSYRTLYLNGEKTGSVTSLNDGGLALGLPVGGTETSYAYPDPGWVAGTVGFGPGGPAAGFDAARRVLTFTSAPLEDDLEIAGPMRLVLFAASTQTDTDFHVKVSDQKPLAAEERGKGVNPAYEIVSRGWLRASHRALDPARTTREVPVHRHDCEEPLVPGEVTLFEIAIEPQAYRFARGHRIRVEIVNGDSPVTEALWPHFYRPDRMGRDTICHSALYPSALVLPVVEG
jgi:hypothetical protein